mmetsp:Transcript_19465/g.49108  ORF Transcript_19465/g.49108 Transcript_19465/m.49108 type:complete len:96 (-) Transcript_19465:318-605(-)
MAHFNRTLSLLSEVAQVAHFSSLGVGFLMMEDLDVNADVCPTCLEIYDCDNPMIMTQCKHHFHLACIYEWLERSQLCPVCSKVMRDVEGHKFLEL